MINSRFHECFFFSVSRCKNNLGGPYKLAEFFETLSSMHYKYFIGNKNSIIIASDPSSNYIDIHFLKF